jgi:hypothetical protein
MRQPSTRALFDYWNALRADGPAPDRADLDPAAIRGILRDMFILARGPGGQWHYRLAGTRLAALAGRELRAESFEAWWRSADRRDATRMLETVADETAPLVAGVEGEAPDGSDPIEVELLLLPLLHENRPGERILGGLFPRVGTEHRHAWHAETLRLISLRIIGAARADSAPRAMTPTRDALLRRQSLRLIIGGRHDGGIGHDGLR